MEIQKPVQELKTFRIDYPSTFVVGAIGAFCLALLSSWLRRAGIVSIDLVSLLGYLATKQLITTPFDPAAIPTSAMLIGWLLHLFCGGLFACLYGLGFKFFHRSGWLLGMLFGAFHWLIAGLFLGWLSARIPNIIVFLPADPPFHSSSGLFGLIWLFTFHLMFGGLIGISTPTENEEYPLQPSATKATYAPNSNHANSQPVSIQPSLPASSTLGRRVPQQSSPHAARRRTNALQSIHQLREFWKGRGRHH